MKAIFTCIAVSACIASTAQIQKIQRCVIIDGILQNVESEYNSQTRENTFLYKGVKTNYVDFWKNNKDYASTDSWYINNEKIQLKDRSYAKYGLPRVLSATDVVKINYYKGVGVYAEPNGPATPAVIYIPVTGLCEFQPYQLEPVKCADTITIKASTNSIKTGQNVSFTATVPGIKEKLSYEWYISDSLWRPLEEKIIGNKDGKIITLSTTGVTGQIKVSVEVKGNACASRSEMITIKIIK